MWPPRVGSWGPVSALLPGLSSKICQDTRRAGAVLGHAEISNRMLGTRN